MGDEIFNFANDEFPSLDCSFLDGFRSVSIDKLHTILKTGIDVDPPDSVIWVNDASKATEYGKGYSNQQVIMMFDAIKLLPTWKEIHPTIEQNELNKLKENYPTEILLKNKNKIWLTKLPKEDRRIATPYETEYARWIPNNQMDSLIAIFVCGIDFDATKNIILETINNL